MKVINVILPLILKFFDLAFNSVSLNGGQNNNVTRGFQVRYATQIT